MIWLSDVKLSNPHVPVFRLAGWFLGWLVGFTACPNFLKMGGKLHLHALIEALAYHVQCLVQQQGLGCFSLLPQRSQQYSPQVKGVAKILGFFHRPRV